MPQPLLHFSYTIPRHGTPFKDRITSDRLFIDARGGNDLVTGGSLGQTILGGDGNDTAEPATTPSLVAADPTICTEAMAAIRSMAEPTAITLMAKPATTPSPVGMDLTDLISLLTTAV